MSKAKITAAYVRVSTTGQNEAGQRTELERWLAGHGIAPSSVRWFVDKKGGNNLQRPAFEKLQAAIFAGEVNSVLVYKLDRISRTLLDGVNVLAGWCQNGIRGNRSRVDIARNRGFGYCCGWHGCSTDSIGRSVGIAAA